jgi:hypothetical protein
MPQGSLCGTPEARSENSQPSPELRHSCGRVTRSSQGSANAWRSSGTAAGSGARAKRWPTAEMMRPQLVTDFAQLEAIYRLQAPTWRARVTDFPSIDRWTDAFDDQGEHWAVSDGAMPVAAARLTIHSCLADVPNPEVYSGVLPFDQPAPIAAMARLVVEPRYSGSGLSRMLDVARLEFCASGGMFIHDRAYVRGAYPHRGAEGPGI